MSLRLIFNLIAISGIFGKRNDDLDILPPPPPFPEFGKDDKELRAAERTSEKEEKKRAKELEQKRKEEEKRKLEERRRKDKLREGKKKEGKQKVFNFFHGLGLVKTEKEKNEIGKRQERRKRQEELNNKRREEEIIRLEEERKRREIEKQKEKELEIKRKQEEERKKQKEIERQQRQDEKRKQKELELKKKEDEKRVKEDEQIKEIPKKKPFLGLFGKKGVDLELEKELKGIEEVTPKQVKKNVEEETLEIPELEEIAPKKIKKKIKEEKIEVPDLEEIEKETEKPELASAEEEIQKAIQGMKVKKRPSIVKRLWKKKEKVKERIETPEVMPRTYDKIDYVELIEEKLHKARLALMDFKFDEAKRIYIEIMRAYNDLEPKKKDKVYEDIKDLYYERKSAEKFAK